MSMRLTACALLVALLASCEKGDSIPQVNVLVAVRHIEAGEPFSPELVQVSRVPGVCPVFGLVQASDMEKLAAARLLVPIEKGEPLRWSVLGLSWPERLSTVVRKQGRTLTVEAQGLQWVRPNDHVDILATLPDPETGELATVTLIQNVVVYAVGSLEGSSLRHLSGAQDPNADKATFLLLPDEVEQVVMAARMGPLTVSLRNPEDLSGTERHRLVLIRDLLGTAKAEKAPGKTPEKAK